MTLDASTLLIFLAGAFGLGVAVGIRWGRLEALGSSGDLRDRD